MLSLLNVAQQVSAALGLGILSSVFAAASTHASSHPTAGLDARHQAAQALVHGVSAALTGAAVILVIALVVALVMTGRRRTEPAVADATETVRQELDAGTHAPGRELTTKVETLMTAGLGAGTWNRRSR